MLKVVAALIWENDKILIGQRPENKSLPLLWEFVGGKVDDGETKEQALARECKEELGVDVTVGDVFMTVIHEYADFTVELTLFHTKITSGTPKNIEHNDIKWISISDIAEFDFCPADIDIVTRLKDTYSNI